MKTNYIRIQIRLKFISVPHNAALNKQCVALVAKTFISVNEIKFCQDMKIQGHTTVGRDNKLLNQRCHRSLFNRIIDEVNMV